MSRAMTYPNGSEGAAWLTTKQSVVTPYFGKIYIRSESGYRIRGSCESTCLGLSDAQGVGEITRTPGLFFGLHCP